MFGALPRLLTYRDCIVNEIPNFNIARFDKLEDYTMALCYANTVHAAACRPVDGLVERNLEGKCATPLTEVKKGQKLAVRLLRFAGQREQRPFVVAAAADLRKRAFTLFSRAYVDARRVILFLRWYEGYADSIAPSLYAGRGGSKKKLAL